MPNKIKLFYIFLAVTAVISVFSFFDVFSGVRSATLFDSVEALPAIDTDTDDDGLMDNEEDYWDTDFQNPDTDGDGFLDGEETASRHDPTIPGPDDFLNDTNMTEKMANLALGGLTEGSLKSSSPDFENSVETLSMAIVDDSVMSFIPEIKISQIKTIETTEENKKIYIQQVDSVWAKFSKALHQEIDSVGAKLELMDSGGMANPEFIEYFVYQRGVFNSIVEESMQIPVPKDWLDKHAGFISYVTEFSKINDSLAKGKDDPIRATVGFNLFITRSEDFPAVLEAFLENLDK